MNPVHLSGWLDDDTLSSFSSQTAVEPSLWARMYDATCPSEFYRGYATLLHRISGALRSGASPVSLQSLINALDGEIQALPADQRREGAHFALLNLFEYVKVGSAAQISATLAAELPCIALCFVRNQARGL